MVVGPFTRLCCEEAVAGWRINVGVPANDLGKGETFDFLLLLDR